MGFGRIGRNIFRILHTHPDIDVVAISEIMPFKTIEYMMRWDTVHGPFPDHLEVQDNALYVAGREVKLFEGKEPGDVPWGDLGVDVVIDATSRFKTRAALTKHLDNGAKRVILTSSPAEGESIETVVMGVNDAVLTNQSTIVSNGSVTINCLAPILKIINDACGIKHASITVVHAYTNSQRLADVPNSDFRSSRSAAENIIPAPTSAPHIIGKILPEMEGKINGLAVNVPIPDGSIIDMVSEMNQTVTAEQINAIVKSAALSKRYEKIIDYVTDPIVSSDIIGNPHSAIFDSISTKVLGGNLLKTLTWFDNGWGYASRVVELIEKISSFPGSKS
jgi:glyceraldehyde 3-phosphate dehydrogenase